MNFAALQSDNAINYATVGFNVMIVASNEQLSLTTPSNFSTLSPDPGWFYQRNGYKATMNGNNVKVLKKWHKKYTPDQVVAGGSQGIVTISGSMKYRWKRKLTYEDLSTIPGTGGPASTTILRGWNYYILCGTQVNTNYASALTAPPVIVMDSYLYFKDP